MIKKLIIATLFFCGIASASFAQTAAKKGNSSTSASRTMVKKGATPATPGVSPAIPPTHATAIKKDGTPDMRYKKNKAMVKPVLKKNGTPDRRYKANKK